jgi:hypothetical protein
LLQIYFGGSGAFESKVSALHVNANKCRLSPNNVPRFYTKTVFWPLCNHFKLDFDGVLLGG